MSKKVLYETFQSRQTDEVEPKEATFYDKNGGAHQRFTQTINGYTVEGASMVMHTDVDGEVIGVNGEYVDGTGLSMTATLTSKDAVEIATTEYFSANKTFEVISAPLPTVVRNFEGDASFAYKVLLKYLGPDRNGVLRFHEDYFFADAHTGRLVQVHPRFFGFSDSSSIAPRRIAPSTRAPGARCRYRHCKAALWPEHLS
jgi:Zn-dependent metalloprotease